MAEPGRNERGCPDGPSAGRSRREYPFTPSGTDNQDAATPAEARRSCGVRGIQVRTTEDEVALAADEVCDRPEEPSVSRSRRECPFTPSETDNRDAATPAEVRRSCGVRGPLVYTTEDEVVLAADEVHCRPDDPSADRFRCQYQIGRAHV